MDPPRRPLNSYVLRLWDGIEGGVPSWRGAAHHIRAGEHVAFTDEATLLWFLRQWVSPAPTAPTVEEARRESTAGQV